KQRALWNGARDGDLSIIEYYLSDGIFSSGIDPNFKYHAENGDSPLHIAAFNGHDRVVALLLSKHASPNILNHQSRTPLHMATIKNNRDVVTLLLEYNADNDMTPLMFAAMKDHTELAQILLNVNAQVDSVDRNNQTALIFASANNAEDIVKLLLDRHAYVNHDDIRCRTPLYVAACYGFFNIVKQLLDTNADVNRPNTDHRTPLFGAAHQGHFEIVKLLLSRNPDVNHSDKDGASPLFIAAQNGHFQIVSILLSSGANVYQTCKDGVNSLQIAKEKSHTNVVEIIENSMTNNVLRAMEAITNEDILTLDALLIDGMDCNSIDSEGNTLLLKAIICNNQGALDRLIRCPGIDIYKPNESNMNPFTYAMSRGFRSMIDKMSYAVGRVVLDVPEEQFHIQYKESLGGGSYANVYKGKYKDEIVAVKIAKESKADDLRREIVVMQGVNSPYFVNLLATSGRNSNKPKLALEYMDSGTLRQYLEKKLHGLYTPLNFTKVEIAWVIANGIAQIHYSGKLHRDLKTENVLLSTTKYIKLADFGLMRDLVQSTMTCSQGSLLWMAPEVLGDGGHYDYAADIYSFGVILTELDTYQL
ncbi:serine/threonine-protein phosphatase 6 regulatory ankyrin repeat subunit A-like, partial [Thraustotheca clavata]